MILRVIFNNGRGLRVERTREYYDKDPNDILSIFEQSWNTKTIFDIKFMSYKHLNKKTLKFISVLKVKGKKII